MEHKTRTTLGSWAGLLCVVLFSPLAAGQQGLLDNETARTAEVPALQQEVRLFDTIGKGIALSFAECTGNPACTPSVDRGEVERILSTLNVRIGDLSQRYDQSKDQDLAQVLISYADARDHYSGYLEELDRLSPESSGDELEPDLDQDQFDLFQDSDEDLQ